MDPQLQLGLRGAERAGIPGTVSGSCEGQGFQPNVRYRGGLRAAMPAYLSNKYNPIHTELFLVRQPPEGAGHTQGLVALGPCVHEERVRRMRRQVYRFTRRPHSHACIDVIVHQARPSFASGMVFLRQWLRLRRLVWAIRFDVWVRGEAYEDRVLVREEGRGGRVGGLDVEHDEVLI